MQTFWKLKSGYTAESLLSSPQLLFSLIDGQKQHVRQELFESSNRSLLVQALLAPTPDMITSTQAISSAAQTVEDEDEENDEDSEDEQP